MSEKFTKLKFNFKQQNLDLSKVVIIKKNQQFVIDQFFDILVQTNHKEFKINEIYNFQILNEEFLFKCINAAPLEFIFEKKRTNND